MITTINSLTAQRVCRFDFLPHSVRVAEPITAKFDDLSEHIASAVIQQMLDDGWKDGACPDCAIRYRACLHGEHHADQAQEMEATL